MQVASGLTPQAAARGAGVCPRTVRKWAARYAAEGVAGGTGTIVCYIAVSAETRRSVAEVVPTVAELAPTVADATERCRADRIAGLRAEGGGGRSDALIHGMCPLAAGLHSADSHDGRDDGVDFLGRSLLIRLFIAGRILADADV
jgi:hypothetical protein